MMKLCDLPTIQVQVKEKGKKSKSFSIMALNLTMDEIYDECVDAVQNRWREKNGKI